MIKSTLLCLRFPFLYPRNRFTNKHYNNWRLQRKMTDFVAKYKVFYKDDTDQKLYYEKRVGSFGEGWKNPWAPIWLYILKGCHKFLELFHCLPTYTELNALKSEAPGWYKNFGIQICKDIRTQLIKDTKKYIKGKKGFVEKFKALFKNPFTHFRIMQWKEKWGAMELYVNGASKELYAIIDRYNDLSQYICWKCGEPATIITSPYGYMLPYCDKCYNESNKCVIYMKKDDCGKWIEVEEIL